MADISLAERQDSAGDLIAFDNSYARLPDRFYTRLAPTPVAAPKLLRINERLAEALGIDPKALAAPDGVAALAGNRVPRGAEPLAMVYAGHQFGNWVPQLGDGRAILLGEVRGRDGLRYDIQLKGSGPTPYSRRGDGRAALGPVLREFIVSEAMASLGIPTTRTLAAVTTGEEILRQDGLQPGAVLTRVAKSHVRVGTFEYFANRGDADGVRILADYVIERLYPQAAKTDNPYRMLLDAVVTRTAELVARWQLVGFIHGVMNTDNTAIAGETIDYGPCAFMDAYDPATVFSSIDSGGRYAYGNQPGIAQWNLVRLAQALLPLLAADEKDAVAIAREILQSYAVRFTTAYHAGLIAKMGLEAEREGDVALAEDLLARMTANHADFTLTFRYLADAIASGPEQDGPVRARFDDPASFDGWAATWRARLARESRDDAARRAAMRAVNPLFIPRNHRVEAALAAARNGDLSLFDELMSVLSKPFDDQPAHASYADPPRPEEVVCETFCGT
jgi:uncharacterized protein YdiU (UPF0061 family)